MAASKKGMLWVNLGLIVAIAAIFTIVFIIGAQRSVGPDAEAFMGADGIAVDVASEIDPDYEPWFSPVFEAESGEIEAGLFALQAGIGGAVVGYAIGALATRRRYERDAG